MIEPRFRYKGELAKYFWALISLFLIAFLIHELIVGHLTEGNKGHIFEELMCIIFAGAFPVYMSVKGFYLLYKKKVCKAKGTAYEGWIKGETLKGIRDPYVVLHISCKGGDVVTPPISLDTERWIALRKCTVYRYKKLYYVDDIRLCSKGEKGINISSRENA